MTEAKALGREVRSALFGDELWRDDMLYVQQENQFELELSGGGGCRSCAAKPRYWVREGCQPPNFGSGG